MRMLLHFISAHMNQRTEGLFGPFQRRIFPFANIQSATASQFAGAPEKKWSARTFSPTPFSAATQTILWSVLNHQDEVTAFQSGPLQGETAGMCEHMDTHTHIA